jgi:hypothetical protein
MPRLTDEALTNIDEALADRSPGVWRKGRHGGEIHVRHDDPDIDPTWREKFGHDDTCDFYAGDLIAESVGREADRSIIAGAPEWLRSLIDEVREHRAKETR